MYVKFVSYEAGYDTQSMTIECSEIDTKELSETEVALAQILVTVRKNGVEQTISLAKSSWHTCFVMNNEGKTIDRMFAPGPTNTVEVAA